MTTLALAGVLLLSAAMLALHLIHVGERAGQAERDLQALTGEVVTQEALYWRAISGRLPLSQARNQVAVSQARALRLLGQTRQEGMSSRDVALLDTLYRRCDQAMDQELDLLATQQAGLAGLAGGVGAAANPDDTSDPDGADGRASTALASAAFDDAHDALVRKAVQLSSVSAVAKRLSDLAILGTVALALLIMATAQYRFRRLEKRRTVEFQEAVRYRSLLDQSADVTLITDPTGVIIYRSPAAEWLQGMSPTPRAVSIQLTDLLHPDDLATFRDGIEVIGPDRPMVKMELRIADRSEGKLQNSVSDGVHLWRIFEVMIQDLREVDAIRGLMFTGHDITDRYVLQLEIEHRATHDALTGLPNRTLLADRLDQALLAGQRDATRPGLLLIDLDRFKEINDTLGHHYGDQLLIQVGHRLSGALRGVDTVSRLGGDEFAVLLPVVADLPAALGVAGKLQDALDRTFRVEDVDLDVEASIGVVLAGEHGSDTSTLLQRADIAMYSAKQNGLGIASYDVGADSHTPERLALLGDLRRALTGDELFLHYQPKVSLVSGQVAGVEALLRWQHPVRGLISPDDFIPLAENTGLIGPLTAQVLELALWQARQWLDQGAGLQVAVNLSARNLIDERLDETVFGLLALYDVDPGLLKLEVTESAVMADPTRALEVLRRLAARGVAISIDDFGAGYTSIRQLRDLPINELKVDRTFVLGIEHNTSNSTIVRSMIELGHNLGLSIVAEGIETRAALDCLIGFGCDVGQGYFLSRPMPAAELAGWQAAWPGLPEPGQVKIS